MGWVTEDALIDGTQADAPTFVKSATSSTDITYYAVMAVKTGSRPDTYEKLSSNSFEADAYYVIGGEQSSTVSTMYYLISYDKVDEDANWGTATTTPETDEPVKFSLSGTATALVAQDDSGNYLTCYSAKKFGMSSTSATVYLDTDGTIRSSSSGNYLRYNYNTGSGGFRWYAGKTTGTQAYFYKVIAGDTFDKYCTTVPTSETATVTSFGWASYIPAYAVSLPEGRAYVVTGVDTETGDVTVSAVTKVPARTPLLLKGEGTVTATILDEEVDAPATNMLSIGTDAAYATTEYPYVLAKDGGAAGFKLWTGEAATLKDRVVLVLDSKVGAASRSFLRIGNSETTGIEERVAGAAEPRISDLQGRRVAANAAKRGLYIVDGKKVVLK